jgi:serralysin
MSTPQPTTTPIRVTGDTPIDAMLNGYDWVLGPDRAIDWSISGGFNGETWTNPPGVVDTVSSALSLISYYADVRFNYVGSFSNPLAASAAGAEINVTMDGANRYFSSNNQYALGNFPTTNGTTYAGQPGDIYLNLRSPANSMTYEPGGVGWTILLHELGHTLGLKHPFNTGAGGQPTFNYAGLALLDKDWVTVMSYDDDYQWQSLAWHPATPMVMDVLALQALYGPNMATNAGDSMFTLTNTNAYATIWDASGFDTLSFATASSGWRVIMPEYVISTINPQSVGVAVPLNEVGLTSPHSLYWLIGDYESLQGSPFADELHGDSYDNRVFGGAGADVIDDAGGSNYLRGDDGNDTVTGGPQFDDINGNMGNDSASGGLGDDWVVGGKDNDTLSGGPGGDLVYGNLGADVCIGDAGNDIVRGGQDNDSVSGGAGDDYVSGDKGDDTISGGAGADLFHTFGDAGLDRVLDFKLAEGDRVLLDPGVTYTTAQSGADTVISMTGGGQMILVGVSLSSLTGAWIFGA